MSEPTARRVRRLLLGLVLARGLALLCIVPPGEGWDEYQHVAYVDHVARAGARPEIGKATVSPELLRAFTRFPQCRHAADQIGHLGALRYPAYWAGTPGRSPDPAAWGRLPLYQAQHAPFYYALAVPVYRLAGGPADLKSSVAALRGLDLILTLLATAIALRTIGRLFPDPRHAAVVGLLIATQPLWLFNGLRVANDALGLPLATAAVALALGLVERPKWLAGRGFLLGCVAGLAVLAKAVHWALVPFSVFAVGLTAARHRPGWLRSALAVVAVLAGLAITEGPEAARNLRRFGGPVPMQEAVTNGKARRTLADQVAAARSIDWGVQGRRLWLRTNLAVGGWSGLFPPGTWQRRHQLLVIAGGLGWGWLILSWVLEIPGRRRSWIGPPSDPLPHRGGGSGLWWLRHPHPPIFRSPWDVLLCAGVVAGYSAEMAYYLVQSRLAWGVAANNPWYAAAAFPWFLALVAGGLLSWPLGRLRLAGPLALAAVHVAAEILLVAGPMLTAYSGGASGMEAIRRLSTLRPIWLGPWTLWIAIAAAVVLLAAALASLRDLDRLARQRPGSSDSIGAIPAPHRKARDPSALKV